MVQFVNIREFKTKTGAVLKRLQHGDVILTVRGKPAAQLRKISERDLSLTSDYAPSEIHRLEAIAAEPGATYKTAADAKRHLKRLAR